VKVFAGSCNVLSLTFTSLSKRGNFQTFSTATTPYVFRIQRIGASSFKVQANDNGDSDWNDLNLDITGDGSFKFTIEGGGDCI
jgi:hypothetical protein